MNETFWIITAEPGDVLRAGLLFAGEYEATEYAHRYLESSNWVVVPVVLTPINK